MTSHEDEGTNKDNFGFPLGCWGRKNGLGDWYVESQDLSFCCSKKMAVRGKKITFFSLGRI